MTPEEIKEGMKLLDEKAPALIYPLYEEMILDWRSLIDTDILDMQFATKCILGQLFGWYDDGVEKIGLPLDYCSDDAREQAVNLGFALPYESGREAYKQLTEQWKQALLEEREQQS